MKSGLIDEAQFWPNGSVKVSNMNPITTKAMPAPTVFQPRLEIDGWKEFEAGSGVFNVKGFFFFLLMLKLI